MSELYFVPTPNWFISRPLDISSSNDDGLLALSVIGSIYFFDFKFKKYYFCIKNAHLKRINSIAFNTSSNSLVSLSLFSLTINNSYFIYL